MNEIRISTPDASMFNDSSGHTEHDRYYKDLQERDLYCESDFFSKIETELLEEDVEVFSKINDVLKEIHETEIKHKKRNRVHDWNNVAQKLLGCLGLLEDYGFEKGTFQDLRDKESTKLKEIYRRIIRALATFYKGN